MATRDTGQRGGLSRRDFLKASAATAAAVGCGLEFAYDPAKAQAYENQPTKFRITPTTCPYCSASCGQRVVVDIQAGSPTEGQVIDMYGDFESPFNSGGLCAKGAGTQQLVTNPRRLGAWSGTHPVNPVFAYDPAFSDGVAYRREGDGAWSKVSLNAAMTEIAGGDGPLHNGTDGILHNGLIGARGALPATYNSKKVAFFGSSHMNNESNYMYRKIIANFGTSNVEHQARI